MVAYKFFYFNVRGLGEIIRQLFHISDIEFEDVRVEFDKWPEYQSKMPFGKMPVLEVDGQQIPESIAIARYIAKKTGHYGANPLEQALVDAFADQYKDFYVEIRPYYYSAIGVYPKTPEELEAAKKDVLFPARDKYFGFLTNYLKKSSTGFLAGGELTFADLILAEHVSTLKTLIPDYAAEFPKIEAHLEKVHNIPALKKWLLVRPESKF